MEASRLHSETPSALPAGTRLGEFELLSVLGVGGFGIVYLAFDHALEREVAVKEYMPASLAGRTETMHVSLRSQSDAETFALGLKSFVNEARLLARFDHPSLLKVHRFWEANGTAYMAMPVMRGRTVKEIRLEMVGPPDEAWLRALLDPLLGAIEKLHSEGVYHRDIAPDNIQIEPGGRPVLLDFGAARRVLSDKSQTLTAILKPAYAPIEQYAEAGAVKQGPWTDIYALGATLHFLLLTRPPPPATTRAVHDEASLLTPQVLPGCSPAFLNIIDWMLAPRPSDRPQSVAALRDVLEGRVPPPVRREPVPSVSQWDRTVMLTPAVAPTATADTTVRAPRPAAETRDDEATMVLPPLAGARVPPAATRPPPVTVAPTPAPAPEPASAADSAIADVTRPPRVEAVAPVVAPAAAAAPPKSSKLIPIGLAAAAALVVAFVAVLWPRQPAPPTTVAEPAASAPVMAAPLPPVPAVPESQITTVTVPTAPGATAPAVTSAAAPAATPATTSPAAAPPGTTSFPNAPAANQPVDKPAPPKVAVTPPPATTPSTTAAAATPRPQPTTPRPQPPTTGGNAPSATAPQVVATTPNNAPPAARVGGPPPEVQPRPPANPTPTTAVAEAPRPVAAGPEARCGGRNPLSYFICMERECLRAESAGHADCQKWRQNAKRE